MSNSLLAQRITGSAAGVPFVALPPASGRRSNAPFVIAWHLMDAPRSEAAFAAAVPLQGLDAWRVYFGLPMTGARLPVGGPDELIRLGFADAVLNLKQPIVLGAADEFSSAFRAVCTQLDVEPNAVGVMGGSDGAAVAQLVLAESEIPVRAAVLISPVIQLRRAVEAVSEQFNMTYSWSDASRALADRLDFVARANELARTAVQVIVGADDHAAFREPAAALHAALHARGAASELVTIPRMGHALAEEPGLDPAPQTPHAAAVDRHAVAWFQRHLSG
jgi:predicted esterase